MLVVFDLDFTLWDCGGTWCDHTNPPYRIINDNIYDSNGAHIRLYNDVFKIVDYLKNNNIKIALASRTGEPEWANALLKLFGLESVFDFKEIYPGSKITHFKELQFKTKIPFSQMLFFDDELRNIEEIDSLGVETVYVRNGINWHQFINSLKLLN